MVTQILQQFFGLKRIKKIIQEQKPDICHIHTTSLFSFFTYLLLKFYRIPVILTVHGLAHIEKQNLFRKKRNIENFIKYIFQSQIEFNLYKYLSNSYWSILNML